MPLSAGRPLASLSSGLLARKGQARPAMRAQGMMGFAAAQQLDARSLDDLGWNDMGEGEGRPSELPPEPVSEVPPVLVAREALREEVERPAEADGLAPGRASLPMAEAGPRAAFTVRLDAARHLRLRLASASANRSAQHLMIDALDALLATMPEVEALAVQPQVAGTMAPKGDRA